MRRLAAFVPAVLLCLAPLASAAPAAGVEQVAEVDFTLTSGRQVWTLYVEAIAPTAASPLTVPRVRLRLQVGQPSARPVTVHETVLRASDVVVGTDAALLSTRLGGVPVQVEWVVPGGVPGGVTANTAVVGVSRVARARVQIGTRSCLSERASVGVRAASLFDLQESAGPFDRALSPKTVRGARCAEPVYPTSP